VHLLAFCQVNVLNEYDDDDDDDELLYSARLCNGSIVVTDVL